MKHINEDHILLCNQASSRICRNCDTSKSKKIQPNEYLTINSQKKSLYAKKNINKGKKFTKNNVTIKGPAGGLLPKYIKVIINKKTKTKILKDEPITWDSF